jgi:FlaA1/EpsC-like NDP-sugar epimerase
MGKPVKILDLAENLIKLSGYTPYKDINIVFTGLRPGEKLYEEILMNEEQLKSTRNELIYIGRPIEFDEEQFEKSLSYLKENMYDDNFDVKSVVADIVPTYHPYKESKV